MVFFEFAGGLITQVTDFWPNLINCRLAVSTWSSAGKSLTGPARVVTAFLYIAKRQSYPAAKFSRRV